MSDCLRRAMFLGALAFSTTSVFGQEMVDPVRGDASLNGRLEITDAIAVLNFLFSGGEVMACSEVLDSNGDSSVNIADPVFLLLHLFSGGEGPPPLRPIDARLCAPADDAAILRGMEIYVSPDPGGNQFACSTCHDVAPEAETEFTRPGHSLQDALRRPSYKGGELDEFLEAANVCRFDWLVTTEWVGADENFLDVVSFLDSLSPREPAPPLVFEIVQPAVEGPSTGNGDAGCELFHSSCVVCHGEGGAGTLLAPSLFASPDNPLDPDYIRTRVRTSGNPDSVYEGLTGGVMPFWSAGKLSDAQVEDLVAYVTTRPAPQCIDDPPPPEGKVLRRGEFTARFHGVMGTIEELDTRRIRVTNFRYDATGIDVRLWLYKDPDIRDGYAIGPGLVRPTPYEGETLVVDIPEMLTPDMYDGVSVWCVPARANFGEGLLVEVDE